MRAAITIQARMGSSRLPGKVLMPVLGRPLLSYQIERLRRSKYASVVICTTELPEDDPIVALAESLDCPVTRGSESDLMARHLVAATYLGAEIAGISGADDPLLSHETFDLAFERFFRGDVSYVKSLGWPLGLNVYVVRVSDLATAYREATDPVDRAELVSWWDAQPERFPAAYIRAPGNLRRRYRLTVDEPADFELHRWIIASLYPQRAAMATEDIVRLLDDNPERASQNSGISQRWLSPEPAHEDWYIVGKGPSLLSLTAADFGPGPVIALNSAIEVVRRLGLPNPVYSMQKDGCIPGVVRGTLLPPGHDCALDVQPPETLILSTAESANCLPDYSPRVVVDVEALGLPWYFQSAAVAATWAIGRGASRLLMYGHDAFLTGDTRRVQGIGLVDEHDSGYVETARRAVQIAHDAGISALWRSA